MQDEDLSAEPPGVGEARPSGFDRRFRSRPRDTAFAADSELDQRDLAAGREHDARGDVRRPEPADVRVKALELRLGGLDRWAAAAQ